MYILNPIYKKRGFTSFLVQAGIADVFFCVGLFFFLKERGPNVWVLVPFFLSSIVNKK